MTTQEELSLQAIGQQVLQQQLAQQQQRGPLLDTVTAQRLRTEQILAERRLAEQMRQTNAAREKAAQFEAQRQKDREQQQVHEATQLKQQAYDAQLAEWLNAGNIRADFDRQWEEMYLRIQQERVTTSQEAYKQQWIARYGGQIG